MTLTQVERGNTWKSQIVYKSGSTNVDCSGNITTLTIYNPLGGTHYGPVSGIRNTTGEYYSRPSTNSTHDLGIYVEEWKTYFDYGTNQGWRPKIDRKEIQIVYVIN